MQIAAERGGSCDGSPQQNMQNLQAQKKFILVAGTGPSTDVPGKKVSFVKKSEKQRGLFMAELCIIVQGVGHYEAKREVPSRPLVLTRTGLNSNFAREV